jgi:hypothetical protein
LKRDDRTMRRLDELIARADDAWPFVEACIFEATHGVDVLPCERAAGEATLLAVQVSTRSPLGSIALRCGGLLVDQGWLRILGAGQARIGGGLIEWNASLGGQPLDPPLTGALLVACDALSGFFAVNGNRWQTNPGEIHYFAPDTRQWQAFDLGYSAFLRWAMSSHLVGFYAGLRWPGWELETASIGPDQALSVAPPLGFESAPVAERSRLAVPARQLWTLNQHIGQEIAGLPHGATVRFKFE